MIGATDFRASVCESLQRSELTRLLKSGISDTGKKDACPPTMPAIQAFTCSAKERLRSYHWRKTRQQFICKRAAALARLARFPASKPVFWTMAWLERCCSLTRRKVKRVKITIPLRPRSLSTSGHIMFSSRNLRPSGAPPFGANFIIFPYGEFSSFKTRYKF